MQYLYNVLKNQSSLPEDALYMIRYHSFYPYVLIVIQARGFPHYVSTRQVAS